MKDKLELFNSSEICKIKREPELKTGSLFLIILFFNISLYSNSFLSEKFTEILFTPSMITDESSDFLNKHFLFKTGGEYFNILRMSHEENDNIIENVDIYKGSLFSKIGIVKGPLGLSLNYSWSNNGFNFNNDEYAGGLKDENYLNKFLLSFWISGENVNFQISGGASGKNRFPQKYKDDSFQYNQPFTSAFQSNQIIYGAILKIKKGCIKSEFKITGEPLFSEIPQIGNVDSEEMKAFPFSLYRNKASFLLNIKSGDVNIVKSGSIDKYSVDSLVSAERNLPLYLDILSYKTNVNIFIKNIEALFAYNILGFNLFGASEYFTYFKMPEGKLNRFNYLLGYKFKRPIDVKFIGENIIGDIPKFDFDFSPFSVWSIFYPKAYRFEDSHIEVTDLGGNIKLSKKWRKVNSTSILLKGSYTKVTLNSIRSEKKIYVFIPVYTDETTLDIINMVGFTGFISLSHNISWKKNNINFKLSQWFPLWNDKNYSQSKKGKSNIKKSIIGGTNIALDYTFSF